jgi:hypothetical protein
MVEPTAVIFNQMEQQGRDVRYLRMDNAGENIDLSKRIKSSDWKLPITVELTARDTPQQNSSVEVGFATLGGRARAMMSHANIPKHLKHLLLPDAVLTATLLDILIPIRRGITCHCSRCRH